MEKFISQGGLMSFVIVGSTDGIVVMQIITLRFLLCTPHEKCIQ